MVSTTAVTQMSYAVDDNAIQEIICEMSDSTDTSLEVHDTKFELAESLARSLIAATGLDPQSDGLKKTPERFAKAWSYLTKGYTESLSEVTGDALFEIQSTATKGMVIVKDIPIFSLCEHHLLPFHGTCHIGYLPSMKVLGLSKFARIADLFARKLQVQERLGQQIAEAIDEVTGGVGTIVVINAVHMCMAMRGVEKPGASTTTISTTGVFQSEADRKAEFFSLIKM